MVTGWVVSITLFVVCGLVALAIVNIINDLDQTTSIGGDVEPESRLSDDENQGRPALSGDAPIGLALASASESHGVDPPLGIIEPPDATPHIKNGFDARSHAVTEGETSADRGAGPRIPDLPRRDG
jgi:hypothetical protein